MDKALYYLKMMLLSNEVCLVKVGLMANFIALFYALMFLTAEKSDTAAL